MAESNENRWKTIPDHGNPKTFYQRGEVNCQQPISQDKKIGVRERSPPFSYLRTSFTLSSNLFPLHYIAAHKKDPVVAPCYTLLNKALSEDRKCNVERRQSDRVITWAVIRAKRLQKIHTHKYRLRNLRRLPMSLPRCLGFCWSQMTVKILSVLDSPLGSIY